MNPDEASSQIAYMREGAVSDRFLGDLNELFHVKARLGIMTLLLSQGETDFSTLKSRLGLTDGNLGAHIRVLEKAGYLTVVKSFVGRRPRTACQVSEAGRRAFAEYLRQLEAVIRLVDPKEE